MGNSCAPHIAETGKQQQRRTSAMRVTISTPETTLSEDTETENEHLHQYEWSLIQIAHKRCMEGDLALKIGDLDRAMSKYQQMLHVPKRIPNNPRAGQYIQQIAMGSMAEVFMQKVDYNDALRLYDIALDISQELNDRRGEAIIRLKIGIIHRDLRQYKRASNQCHLAVDIFREVHNQSVDEAIALRTLGSILHKRRGKLEASKQCYRRARAIFRAHNDRQLEETIMV